MRILNSLRGFRQNPPRATRGSEDCNALRSCMARSLFAVLSFLAATGVSHAGPLTPSDFGLSPGRGGLGYEGIVQGLAEDDATGTYNGIKGVYATQTPVGAIPLAGPFSAQNSFLFGKYPLQGNVAYGLRAGPGYVGVMTNVSTVGVEGYRVISPNYVDVTAVQGARLDVASNANDFIELAVPMNGRAFSSFPSTISVNLGLLVNASVAAANAGPVAPGTNGDSFAVGSTLQLGVNTGNANFSKTYGEGNSPFPNSFVDPIHQLISVPVTLDASVLNYDGLYRYYFSPLSISLIANSSAFGWGSSSADVLAMDTARIVGLTFPDATTPQSAGDSVQFASGFTLPAASVPEPSSLVLLCTGAIGALGLLRRSRG